MKPLRPPTPSRLSLIGRSVTLALGAAALGLSLAFSACQDPYAQRTGGPMAVDPQDRISAGIYPALHGTVGEFAVLADAMPYSVEGWGVVVNLHGKGSGDMDQRIKDYLENRMVIQGAGSWMYGMQKVDPDAILASRDIAVVEVRGIIPPLARKGATFDLSINALAGSQTQSLQNGLLWTTELKRIGLTSDGNDSATIALGRGAVFVSGPVESAAGFLTKEQLAEAPRALRKGRVIGGGTLAEDNPLHLQLYSPSAYRSRVIEHIINSRFPARDRTASADDAATISLRIPEEYAMNPAAFIDIIRHLYINADNPGFDQQCATLLINSFQDPAAPKRDLSLALQGLGRAILPDYVEKNYTSPNTELRFWCARAGANLQDSDGMVVLQEMISDRSNPFRHQALDALVEASIGHDTDRASMTLLKQLNNANTEERVRAYQGLVAMRSRMVRTFVVSKQPNINSGKFLIDLVPSEGPPLIYASQADTPRIAFIGRAISLPDGASYISPDKLLTVRVDDAPGPGDVVPIAADTAGRPVGPGISSTAKDLPHDNVTIYYRRPPIQQLGTAEVVSGGPPVKLRVDSYLPDLISLMAKEPDPSEREPEPFVGASYQRITEMLAELCRDQVVSAKFVLQPAPKGILTVEDVINSGRPEGSVTPLRSTTEPSTEPATEPATQPGTLPPDGPTPVAPLDLRVPATGPALP